MKSSPKKKTAATRRAKPARSTRMAVRKAAKPASRTKNSSPAPMVAGLAAGLEAVALNATAEEVASPASRAPAAMPESATSSPQRAGLKLEASFTLRDATDMLFQLLAVDFGDSDVLVDGSAVERIDTAGLQMLIAFAKAHAARGKTLHWTAVSPELLRSSQLLGVTEPLHLATHLHEGVPGGH